ncbi:MULTISPECIES: MATE family efflux transporter [Clostridium]|nr:MULTISPECIES: MATE family efflux transporter [Clostridium]MDU4846863.1 MATE family efflux transporter [Clostridium sp.]CAH0438125.1 Putative drug/sodium antiporter, MATE family [Clostridium neonatale]CAI3196645.1 putative drug/sodium antiporter, MATE family [Clostridium neonatale]CAI3202235.1 putative drug/sodium antiporter, MATE family [Clostridium neonatale]CAI3239384.1 putative drug/sodium antiporter, MATE family [Clostridium neonatale]
MMAESKKTCDNMMENGNLGNLIMKFAVPCVIAMVVNSLYSIVDQIFIGQGVGYVGNAATNVTFPLVVLAIGFSLLLGDGAAAFYSIKLGENNKEEGSKAIGNAILLLGVLGLIFLSVGYIFIENMLWSFGATAANISYALDYMKIILIGFPFMIFACGLNSIIRADGSPEYSMAAMIVGAVINIILDPIFIFIFHMGVTGAAIATVIGQIISCIISVSYMRKFKNINFKRSILKFDKNISKTIMSFGISSLITQVAVTLIIIVSNNALAYYGAESIYGSDIPISSMGIVMKVNEILISIVIGIAVGGQPILGYNYGARNFKRVKDTYFMIIKIATIVSILGFINFQFFPQSIINLFGQSSSLYNEFALKSFKIFLMLCPFIGFELTTCIFFQAIGEPVKAIILTLCKQTFFIIPLMIILPRFIGVEGVLYAGPFAEGISVLCTLIFTVYEMNKLNKIDEELKFNG